MKTLLDFDVVSRARVRASRPLLQWARRTPWVRKQLLARRASDIARGLDPDTAIMLELVTLNEGRLRGRRDADARETSDADGRRDRRRRPGGRLVLISEHTVDTGDGGIPAALRTSWPRAAFAGGRSRARRRLGHG